MLLQLQFLLLKNKSILILKWHSPDSHAQVILSLRARVYGKQEARLTKTKNLLWQTGDHLKCIIISLYASRCVLIKNLWIFHISWGKFRILYCSHDAFRYMFSFLFDTEHNSWLCSSNWWGFRQSKTDRLWVHKE